MSFKQIEVIKRLDGGTFGTRTFYDNRIIAIKIFTPLDKLNSCSINIDRLIEGERIVVDID